MLPLVWVAAAMPQGALTTPPPPPPVSFANELWPRIHFTPACYQAGGPHDIAGAIHLDGRWHVMGYCNHGHWQHSVSEDLVSWRMVGPPRQFGGTGGMIADGAGRIAVYAATGSARHPKHCPACPQPRDGTEVSCSWKCPAEHGCSCKNTGKHADCSAPSDWSCVQESNCRFWTNTSADLSSWVQDNATAFPSSNDTNCDRVWRDGQSWYAFTAGRVGGYGGGGSRGGQENLYANSRAALHGAGADCECGKAAGPNSCADATTVVRDRATSRYAVPGEQPLGAGGGAPAAQRVCLSVRRPAPHQHHHPAPHQHQHKPT